MRHDPNIASRIKDIQSFASLLKFLREDLDWPITSDDVEDLTFEYSPDELGFDKKMAVKVRSIKQLRPLVKDQPWGIFYIDFEPKRLPVGALRRLLRSLVIKKRGGGDGSRAAWSLNDLLFISFHGEESHRTVAFAHFHERPEKQPQLRTFYWDKGETEFQSVLESLASLSWPKYAGKPEMEHVWRDFWSDAFRAGHGEVIRDSKALSKQLARVALKIRQHVFDLLDAEDATRGPLHRLFASFKKALLHDLDEQRFADVLAQTFTYGLLAAKAELGTETSLEPGHLAEQIPATNPLLRELFEEFQHLTGVGLDKLDADLGDLGVDELVDLLNSVDVDEALKNFGRTTMSGQEDPVVHFYEEFLKEYDKAQKVERGVFYTPKPVVSFIVRSVHELLQKEFGLEDGLASTATWDDMVAKHQGLAKPEGIRGNEPFVQILDPAVGTGTFLEACIQLIYDTMAAKWSRAGKDVKVEWNRYVPEHLLPRLHGFELMMAPYVVCHMKLGLRLKELGYDFQSGERLRVFLSNALEPGVERQSAITGLVPAVAHEAHSAAADKREKRFSVVIGNPPYANYSANLSPQARRIVDKYRTFRGVPIRERNQLQFERNIQDDFVKFMSIGQDMLEATGAGVFGFITNGTMLASTSLRGLRERLASDFGRILELNLHGGAHELIAGTEGDANVFDIVQSVAIHLYSRFIEGNAVEVKYADLIGSRATKYEQLVSNSAFTTVWRTVWPDSENCSFIPQDEDSIGPRRRLDSIFVKYGAGIKTNRDASAIGFDDTTLLDTVRQLDVQLADAKSAHLYIHPLLYRPFDVRKIFYHQDVVASRSLPTMQHIIAGPNIGLVCSGTWTTPERFSVGVSRHMIEMKTGTHDRGTSFFPLYRYESFLGGGPEKIHNLSPEFVREWSASTKTTFVESGSGDVVRTTGPDDVISWLYGIFYSPEYRCRYRTALSQRFPIVVLPGSLDLLREVSRLGKELIALHLLESTQLSQAITQFVGPSRVPEKIGWTNQTVWLDAGGVRAAQSPGTSGFKGVSEEVWGFHFGGYQVCEKWLKDRRGRTLLDEDLAHYDMVVHAVQETIRIMAEIDEVIEAHGGWPGAFHHSVGGAPS